MNIYQLRDIIGQEVVDFNQLKDALKLYAHPRRKIADWLDKGELIRVKKGLYVFGDAIRRAPFSLEVLANLIYGPSAISLNYALSYYGLIPERVHTITSITNKRNKEFNTPVGRFTYRYLSDAKFSVGVQLLSLDNKLNILIATPEKALCDIVALTAKDVSLTSQKDFEIFVFDDLRIDQDAMSEMAITLLNEIVETYRNKRLSNFFKYFNAWKNKHE